MRFYRNLFLHALVGLGHSCRNCQLTTYAQTLKLTRDNQVALIDFQDHRESTALAK